MAIDPKRKANINARKFDRLMKDIEKDVGRRTINAKNTDDWMNKLGMYVNRNPFAVGGVKHDETVKILNDIMGNAKFKGLARGGTQELVKGVIAENTMHYVTRMGDDMKNQLRRTFIDSYNNKLPPREIAKKLQKEVQGLSKTRAMAIARTETMRASNLSNYVNAKLNMGARSYHVRSDPGCCDKCAKIYNHGAVWFDIDDLSYFPPIHPNAWIEGHKILCKSGWVDVKDINYDSEVLSFNPMNWHEKEFIKPKCLHKYIAPNVIRFKNTKIHLEVTPDHECYIGQRKMLNGERKIVHEVRYAKDLNSESYLINKTKPVYKISEPTEHLPSFIKDMDSYAWFLGWYLSEGYIDYTERNYDIRIGQRKSANPENYLEIFEGLKNIFPNINLNEHEDFISFHNKEIWNYLKQFGKQKDRFIPEWFFDCDSEILEIFLNAFNKGDGFINCRNVIGFVSSSEKLIEGIELILSLLGKPYKRKIKMNKGDKITISGTETQANQNIYQLEILNREYRQLKRIIPEDIAHNDFVYSLTLPKWETLYIKDLNDSVYVLKNCRCVAAFSTKTANENNAVEGNNDYVDSDFHDKIRTKDIEDVGTLNFTKKEDNSRKTNIYRELGSRTIISNEDIYQAIDRLPNKLKNIKKDIYVVNKPHPKSLEGKGGGKHDFRTGDVQLFVTQNTPKELYAQHIIPHETTHLLKNVNYNSYKNQILLDEQNFQLNNKEIIPPSNYAKNVKERGLDTWYKEDLAESVAKYLQDPRTFEGMFPNRADFIKKLLEL